VASVKDQVTEFDYEKLILLSHCGLTDVIFSRQSLKIRAKSCRRGITNTPERSEIGFGRNCRSVTGEAASEGHLNRFVVLLASCSE
jgi:hypothetical protein